MLYNNQQGCQAADENTKSAITTWRLLAYTCTLGIILGVTDADRTFNFLGVLVCEHCLEPLSLNSALWLRLDCASTCPRLWLWCLGFAVVPFLCFACELGSAWSTPPYISCLERDDAGCWIGNVTSMAGCAWWSYTLLNGAEEASEKDPVPQVFSLWWGSWSGHRNFTYSSTK